MEYVLKGFEPADAVQYFEDIAAIPHGSKNEKAVAEYVIKFCEERGLWYTTDELHNIIIKKPGSKGCEHLPAVILQGHLDMVCEKNQDVVHDFEKDGLKLKLRDGKILYAEGTTLGADDAVAIAYMMAILNRNDLVHPPLECVMTVQEEIGLIGALALDGSCLTAKRMIGMDAGSEGSFLVSSAGGGYVNFEVPCTHVPASGEAVAITVRGLIGGHSAGMIDAERGNSNKIMARLLYNIGKTCKFTISTISGGAKANAIPREADAVIVLQEGTIADVQASVDATVACLKQELEFSDPNLAVTVSPATAETMLDATAHKKLMRVMHLAPNGLQMMNKALNLPNASLNMGVVTTYEDKIVVVEMIRNSTNGMFELIADVLLDLADTVGVTAYPYTTFPAFDYSSNSPLRDLAMDLYKRTTGKDASIRAVHGGTECGVFRTLCPGIDIIGFGPIKGEAHTFAEWMDMDSYNTTFQFLCQLLEEITKL